MPNLKLISLFLVLTFTAACGDKEKSKNKDMVLSGVVSRNCEPIIPNSNIQSQDPNIRSVLIQVHERCRSQTSNQEFVQRLNMGMVNFSVSYVLQSTQSSQYNQYNQLPNQQPLNNQYIVTSILVQ